MYSRNRSASASRSRASRARSGEGRHDVEGSNSTNASSDDSSLRREARRYSRNSASASSRYKARKPKGGKKKVVGIVVGIIAVILIAAGIAVGSWWANISDKISSDIPAVEPTTNEPYYVLVLGGDSRLDSKKDNRSDSMMVARIDEKNKKVSLLSIPRDLRVYIDGQGYCKINAAITYGGVKQAIATVSDVMDIEINYYAFIYFDGFEDLVDKLDGVTVEVPEGTYYNGVSVPAGDAVLINGKEALTLARCRHGNPPDQGAYAAGDYQRTLNQRNLMKAIAKKILEQPVTSYPKLLSGLAECVETNMSVRRMVKLASAMKGFNTEKMRCAQLYTAADVVNGGWYAALYEDVFQIQRNNFVNGKKLSKGLKKFNTGTINADMSAYCVDGKKYAYVYYEKHFGSLS